MYQSNQGVGWVGVGFSLEMGAIQRSTKHGLNYDLNDFMAVMNGVYSELVQRGDWGSNYFGARIESNLSKYFFNSATKEWVVTRKDGTQYLYGSDSTSRQDFESGQKIFKWCLNKVIDVYGNYMTLSYTKDSNGQIYLDTIQYTGNANINPTLNPTHSVKFILEDRTDIPIMYITNYQVKTVKRLKSIEVYDNGALQRKYVLNYEYSGSSARSRLISITQYGKDGVSALPPTTFDWQTGGEVGSYTGVSQNNLWGRWSHSNTRWLTADVSGDAKADIIGVKNNSNHVRLVTGVSLGNGNYISAIQDTSLAWDENAKWFAGDTNSDSKADIIGVQSNGSYTQFITAISSGTSSYTLYTQDNTTIMWDTNTKWFPADVNSDSKADIIGVRSNSNYTQFITAISSGTGSYTLYTQDNTTIMWDTNNKWFPADVNGDGKVDIMGVRNNSSDMQFVAAISSGNGQYTLLNQDTTVSWDSSGQWFGGDVNGDGKVDLMGLQNKYLYTAFSSGSGSFTLFSQHTGWSGFAFPGDVNGDGKTDFMFIDAHYYDTFECAIDPTWLMQYDIFHLHTARSNGDGTFTLFGPQIASGLDAFTSFVWRVDDMNGDGKTEFLLLRYYTCSLNNTIKTYSSQSSLDLITDVTNSLGGHTSITYTPSSDYQNTLLPFTLQTVSRITADDGRGQPVITDYSYSGGFFDYAEREFRGFRNVTAYQMRDTQYYESKTEILFHQDFTRKGMVEKQITTSYEGHERKVENTWTALNVKDINGNDLSNVTYPRLDRSTTTMTDAGYAPYTFYTDYVYDPIYLSMKEEHKYGITAEEEVHTYITYANFATPWILSKPTDIMVTDKVIQDPNYKIVSRKWMDYDSNNGNLQTEEVCKSDNPNNQQTGCLNRNPSQNSVTTYQYHPEGNLHITIDPKGYLTALNYDATKTYVYEKINCNNTHITTTEYDTGTGNLKKLILPHLTTPYSITYEYDVFGRKILESRPDGGFTAYQYLNIGNPTTQYVEKREHIVSGVSPLDHYTFTYFDGLGRTYWVESTGPNGKRIIVETWYDELGRISDRSNPYFYGIDAPYYNTFTYDGLSRVIDVWTPDNYHIGTSYQGLKKVVTNQRGVSTAYTYDVYQRLKKVEENYNPATGSSYSTTEYTYDTLGNLITVIAAKGATEQNTTTMTYNSLSKKKTMTDPDMGFWTYDYDKSGNLEFQTDAKGQTIRFRYDGLNRVYEKWYGYPTPTSKVFYTYDDPSVPYSKGKLTKVSYQPSGEDLREDSILEYDIMQRVKSSKKKIGAQEVTFVNSYDSAGRVISITYPGNKTYSYEYDVAGNLLYLKDNASGTHLADYSDYNAIGKPMMKTFPKAGGGMVKTSYEYYPDTGRLKKLVTEGMTITNSNLNNMTHNYTYDALNRLTMAQGDNGVAYNQTYTYDRIGNIQTKSDVQNGNQYIYNYLNKPHAVRSVGSGISLDYDANGNMTQKVEGGVTTAIQWNYDNRPTSITKGSITVAFAYDGNGQRVKKVSSNGTALYFGALYETRGGVGILHLFAGNQRVASVIDGGYTQFYHPDHLGSTWMVTDPNGEIKEKNEFYPFGTYRPSPETFDYDPSYPDVFYTFTGQEEDDELGLYNYGARLYDPVLGRFISPDSIVPDFTDPQSFNRYSYVLNNPLRYIDPMGYQYGEGEGAWNMWEGSIYDTGGYYGSYSYEIQWDSGSYINNWSSTSYGSYTPNYGYGYYVNSTIYVNPTPSITYNMNTFGIPSYNFGSQYVANNPIRPDLSFLLYIDRSNLPSLVTDITQRTTTFYPRPFDSEGQPITIETRVNLTSDALPGAGGPFITPNVAVIDNISDPRFGPPGAYIDTGDPRGRDIHGGGSGLTDPYAPRQGWVPTPGCTRGQNEDVRRLGDAIQDFQRRYPGIPIPYTRRR